MSHKHKWNWIVIVCVRPWFPFFLVSWDRMDLWAFMYQKGIAKVSLRVSLWDWRECGKKETIPSFARKHEWTNCTSRYCKVSLLVVRHIAFHGLEPLSRKKSTSQEDSYMKSLAGFSYIYIFTLPIDRRRPSPRDLLFLDGVTRNCQAEAAIADQCWSSGHYPEALQLLKCSHRFLPHQVGSRSQEFSTINVTYDQPDWDR